MNYDLRNPNLCFNTLIKSLNYSVRHQQTIGVNVRIVLHGCCRSFLEKSMTYELSLCGQSCARCFVTLMYFQYNCEWLRVYGE